MAEPVHLINGPNLNLLGAREPDIYGSATWAEIESRLQAQCGPLGVALTCRQSNSEGTIIDWIHEARTAARALILNAGAYTHTSLAILDAVSALTIPVIEVHLSNPGKRESFRRRSYISRAATGIVSGFGPLSYELALSAAARLIAAASPRALSATAPDTAESGLKRAMTKGSAS